MTTRSNRLEIKRKAVGKIPVRGGAFICIDTAQCGGTEDLYVDIGRHRAADGRISGLRRGTPGKILVSE